MVRISKQSIVMTGQCGGDPVGYGVNGGVGRDQIFFRPRMTKDFHHI
jgi:hypothetical protein